MYKIHPVAFQASRNVITGNGQMRASCVLLIFHSAATQIYLFFVKDKKEGHVASSYSQEGRMVIASALPP